VTAFTRVHITSEAQEDIRRLPDKDVQRAVIEALLEIENNLEFGPLLDVRGATGDLRGCRKVYVDKVTPDKPRFRIVYWCSPDERRPRRAAFSPSVRARAWTCTTPPPSGTTSTARPSGRTPSNPARTNSSAWTPENEREE
jgi:hypothetical protein